MGATVTLKGLDKLQAVMTDLGRQARIGAEAGVHDALIAVRDAWAAGVPVDEGNYRAAMQQDNAVKTRVSATSGAVGYVNVPWVKGVPGKEQPQKYASRLEHGDEDRAPQPSARPALDQVRGQLPALVGEQITASVRKTRPRR